MQGIREAQIADLGRENQSLQPHRITRLDHIIQNLAHADFNLQLIARTGQLPRSAQPTP